MNTRTETARLEALLLRPAACGRIEYDHDAGIPAAAEASRHLDRMAQPDGLDSEPVRPAQALSGRSRSLAHAS